ncbi:hypothetical protein ACXJY6_06810 [Vibrio sp. RC27]
MWSPRTFGNSKCIGDGHYIDVALRCCDVEFVFNNVAGKRQRRFVKILECLLYSDKSRLSFEQEKVLFIDFCRRNKYLKRNGPQFNQELSRDLYFHAIRVKFGYAITCHKAQGSKAVNGKMCLYSLVPALTAFQKAILDGCIPR